MRRVWAMAVLVCTGMLGCDDAAAPAGFELTITLLPATAEPGEDVRVTVEARNTGRQRVEWGTGSSSCRLTAIIRVDGAVHRLDRDRACTTDVITLALDPGESRTESWIWPGEIAFGDALQELEVGDYEVRAAAGEWVGPRETLRIVPR